MTRLDILQRLEGCFVDDEIETTMRTGDAAIRVVHRPTGIEVIVDRHRSQIANKAEALVELLGRLLDTADSAEVTDG
ncbi:MAG: peptide chain release factor-like protein [Acidobacteriota bacterium]